MTVTLCLVCRRIGLTISQLDHGCSNNPLLFTISITLTQLALNIYYYDQN